jgi:streptogramin lyase
MRRGTFLGAAALGAVLTSLAFVALVEAQTVVSVALTGKVTSQAEGAMEGVLVSAKRESSTVTITVVSNAQGQYSFPKDRLEPGKYTVTMRAVGYELPSPGSVSVNVSAQQPAVLDLSLAKTKNLSLQLTSGEWLQSFPGTDAQKQGFLECTGCHQLQKPAFSRYNAQEMAMVLQRMTTYSNGSQPSNPQRVPGREIGPPSPREIEMGKYVSGLNLSAVSEWEYPLKTNPRPKGTGTQVIITEYDLPRPNAAPHDVRLDPKTGLVWYDDFAAQWIGKLDPKTGTTTEYQFPVVKPGYPLGSLRLSLDSREDVMYVGNMFQAQFLKFDPATEKFTTYPRPNFMDTEARVTMLDSDHAHVDGHVWANVVGAAKYAGSYQVDLKTNTWTKVTYAAGSPPAAAYDFATDSKNNMFGFALPLASSKIWRTDAKTLHTTWIDIPSGDGGGRRGKVDAQDRVWFAQFSANRLAMFDPRTEKITQWEMPTPWTNPYDAMYDDKTYVWTASMSNDYVARMNVKTGEFTQYFLPRYTNIRSVEVDKSAALSSLWVGNAHGAKVLHIEPLGP